MELYFITGNINKFKEAKELIPVLKQLPIDLPEIQEINPEKIIAAKLEQARAHHSGNFVVEDTSLYLDCLPGLPGPLIKWFMETIGNDGIFELCQKYNHFTAEGRTLLGLMDSKNNIHYFEGRISGRIVKPEIENTFGWDAIFQPDGHKKSFADLSMAEKNKISMRGLAFKKLSEHLERL